MKKRPRRRNGGKKLSLGGWIVLSLVVLAVVSLRFRATWMSAEYVAPQESVEATLEDITGELLPDDGGKLYEIVWHKGYTLGYSEDWEQAAWVYEELEGKCFDGPRVKRTDDFRADPSVSTRSATPADYVRSGYDRGHLAPAADFAHDKDLVSESFYMSNMSPQVPSLNRGAWKDLEEWVRSAAKREGKIIVVTGPITSGAEERIGANNVLVPKAYFKAIYDTTPPEKMIAFFYLNRDGEPRNVRSHAMSVDEVEMLSGLDLFPGLEDEKENALEASAEFAAW